MAIDRSDHRPKGNTPFPTKVDGDVPNRNLDKGPQKALAKSLSQGKFVQANRNRIFTPGKGWTRLNDGP